MLGLPVVGSQAEQSLSFQLVKRCEGWWLNPDEELLDTVENVEYLSSAIQLHLGHEVQSEAVHVALLRAATRPEAMCFFLRHAALQVVASIVETAWNS